MPRSVLLAALLVTLTTPLSPISRAAPAAIFPTWINGENCATEPKIQSFAYDANTYILRQSMCTDFEGPFIYLLFGQEKVLMVDSGASANPPIPLQQTVQRIINRWLSAHGQASIQLVVAHSHAHGDHIAGDGQFAGKPNTTVVGTSVNSVQTFFGITTWPTQIVTYELGGRTVDVIPIPGHETAHIAFYDRNTRLLLTGDTLYPGRLYISDFPTYVQSVQRLVDFTSVNQVSYVLGAHIEMSAVAGEDFPIGSTYHPNEHVLQLRRSHLLELLGGLLGMQGSPHIETHDDFVIYPL
jgi:glyoxylase-like metal-dependent hydrolase (beta-lactamase superfamily II)